MIRPDTPVLSPGSRVVPQVEDGVTRYVVRAGVTGKYLRVGEPEAVLLGLMDGTRTLPEVRTSFIARQKESIDLADIAVFLGRMRKLETLGLGWHVNSPYSTYICTVNTAIYR